MEQNRYQKKRPYRVGKTPAATWLVSCMDLRFERDFDDYWQQFGYEIGGPVCYAYVKWFSEQIDEHHPEMTDIAFVARDGWILKRIYEKLPHRSKAKPHYIYAPRAVLLQSRSEAGLCEYRKYLQAEGFGGGEIGVVDTVTMNFSSQRLIFSADVGKTHGFFWCVLRHAANHEKEYSYTAYQAEKHHIIRNWNVMEFIMTSPEPPILCLQEGVPVYQAGSAGETLRRRIFASMETGILSFIDDVCREGVFPQISNAEITEWMNDFLRNPDEEDLLAFEPVRFSEKKDHSDDIALDPFGQEKKPFLKTVKDRAWFWSQNHKNIYAVLRFGNQTIKKTLRALRGADCDQYCGEDQEALVEKLSQYDVVSFDVFDTLILRPYKKPTDLFYELEKKHGLADFHDVRVQAERDARQHSGKGNGEVDIWDIYAEIKKHYDIDPEVYARKEIQQELQDCYANADFLSVYKALTQKGCRMIAVSDMYLPAQHLRDLLDGCGYHNFEEIFVSCEYGMGKYDGSLQRLVHEHVGKAQTVIHVGDNYDSDVKMSQSAGWAAVLYRRS